MNPNKRCPICGAFFRYYGFRWDRTYCSNRCRQKAYRKRCKTRRHARYGYRAAHRSEP